MIGGFLVHTHTLDMTTGSPVRLLLRFALPLFIGNLLQQIYNLSDTAIAGHLLGDAALSQIGATAALYSLITTLAFGLNSGFALSVSRYFGADDSVRMAQSVRWMTTLSTLCAAVITISFLLARFALADAMQIPADIRDGALTYLTVILAGIPLTMAYNLESSLMQAVGNSVTPLLFLIFSSFLNIALDLLFMGPLGLGVGGAAAATVLSQGISAVLGLFHILRREPNLRLGKRVSRAPRGFVSDMLLTGLSMALMSAIYSVGSVILQGSINALGNVYIAAQVGGRRLTELFHMPGIALGASVATYASQNFGANRRRRIVQGQWVALAVYGVWWLFALAFTFTAAPTAIRFITGSTNPDVLKYALLYLHVGIPMIPPMAVVVIVRNALQGMRHTLAPLICSAIELACKAVFSFKLVPALGYPAVCACEPVAWMICMIFILAAAYAFKNDLQDVGEERT